MINKGLDISRIINLTLDKIHTLAEARIVEVNNSNMTASVKILKKLIYRGQEYSVSKIDDVPIKPISYSTLFACYSPFSVGDKVTVGFYSDNNLEALNSSSDTSSYDKTKFNINSCVILGGSWENRSVTNPYPEDFLILNKSNTEYIRVKKNGGLEIKGDLHHIGNYTNTGDITSDGAIDAALDITSGGEISADGEITDGTGLTVSREHKYIDDGIPGVTTPL